jgi:hypothetical protein
MSTKNDGTGEIQGHVVRGEDVDVVPDDVVCSFSVSPVPGITAEAGMRSSRRRSAAANSHGGAPRARCPQ